MKPLKINFYKIFAYGFLSICLVFALFLALAFSSVGVTLGVKYANKFEGLALGEVSGSFYTSVKLSTLSFQNQLIQVNAKDLSFDLGVNCLFLGKACIQELSFGKVNVELLQSENTNSSSSESEEYIELPISISLDVFKLGDLSVSKRNAQDKTELMLRMQDIFASGRAKKQIVVDKLQVAQIDVYSLSPNNLNQESRDIEYWLNYLDQYKYQKIILPEVFVPINANIKNIGVLRFCWQSQTTICSDGTKAATSIRQQVLDFSLSTHPVEQKINHLVVDSKLDLNNKFAYELNVNLSSSKIDSASAEHGLNLALIGDRNNIDIRVSDTSSNQIMHAKATFDVEQDTLPIELNIEISDIQNALDCCLSELEVPLAKADLSLIGNTNKYLFTAKSALNEQAVSEVSIDAQIFVNDKKVHIEQVKAEGSAGELKAKFDIALAQKQQRNTLILDSGVSFQNLDFSTLADSAQSDIKSKLNGNITFNAELNSSALVGSVLCKDISGQLQAHRLFVDCDIIASKDGKLTVNKLELKQAKNRLVASGKLKLPFDLSLLSIQHEFNQGFDQVSEQNLSKLEQTISDFRLNINIVDLGSISSQMQGKIYGTVDAKGKGLSPSIMLDVNLEHLLFDRLTVEKASIKGRVQGSKNWNSQISLLVNNISQDKLLANEFNVELKGDLKAHSLQFKLQHPDYKFEQMLSGAFDHKGANTVWKGRWREGLLSAYFETLKLYPNNENDTTAIEVTSSSVKLAAHCWRSVTKNNAEQPHSQLCLDKLSYQNEELKLSAKLDFELAKGLKYYLPDMILANSSLPINADIKLNYSVNKGLGGRIYSFLSDSVIVTPQYKVDLTALVANFSLDKQILTSSFYAGSQEFGAIGAMSTLQLATEQYTHSGDIHINSFSLAALQRFLPGVEEIAGTVHGNLGFTGTLTSPIFNGGLVVNEAQMVIDNYPYPVSNFTQNLEIVDNKAKVSGEFDLGNGSAKYWSDISFNENINIVGGLKGAGMQIAYENSELLASPDLSFSLNKDLLSLKGDIVVPNADIKIKELPESARSPSEDTIIIGQEAPSPALPIGLDVDLKILLDPAELKRVNITALDLKASLGSDLQLVMKQKKLQNAEGFSPLQTLLYGSVTLLSGSYDAYGQSLQIQNGNIYFSGLPNLPQFDIKAIRNPLNTEDNVVAGIRISGNPMLPQIELFSEPSMIQARQISYLVAGVDIDGGSGSGTSTDMILLNALVAYGIGNSENGINRLGRSVGIEQLSLQTAGSGNNAQLQLSGRIADNIQLTYGVGLLDQSSEVILKYNLLPKLYIEAKSGATNAVDIFYEFTRQKVD